MEILKTLSKPDLHPKAMYSLCKEAFGSPIGRGTGRWVFAIDDKSVIKVARDQRGMLQNVMESDAGSIGMYPDLLAACLDRDDEYRFLIAERLAPVTRAEINRFFGMPLTNVINHIDPYSWNMVDRAITEEAEELENLVADLALAPGDLRQKNHWGRSRTGDIKILDFGLTCDLWKSHYCKKQAA